MLSPNDIIYLDNNATTRLDPAVVEEMLPFLSDYYGNPSSGYGFGAQVQRALELARERVAQLLGCSPGEIVFTSGGTEANNSAIQSALQLNPESRHVVTTAVEHSAVLRPCEALVRHGFEVSFTGVDHEGNLDLDSLTDSVRRETAVVSVMWANNETGVIFPIDEIAERLRAKRVLFHTDAVQAAGKIPLRLGESAIHLASISAHKLHGPKGVGALFIHRRGAFRPLLLGGGQENERRAGTENVASIVGFGKAAELAAKAMNNENTRVRALRDRFEDAILAMIADAFVNGSRIRRLPNTSSLSFSGIDSAGALILLDRESVCCSAGSACLTGAREKSHVLRAMSLGEDRINGSLRFSFSRFTTDDEVTRALEILPRVINKLRALSVPHSAIR